MSKHGDMQVKPQLYQYRTGDLLGWVRSEAAEIGPLRGRQQSLGGSLVLIIKILIIED